MKWSVDLIKRFGVARISCVILLFAFVFLRIIDPAPIEELRLRVFDFFQVIRPRVADQRPVVIVDIDERSLRTAGQWPWPRTLVADLVTRLNNLGAAVIGFDVIFAEPDRLSPQVAAEIFPNLDDDVRRKLRALPSSDEIFADAIRHAHVVLGETGLSVAVPERNSKAAPAGIAMLGGNPKPFLLSFPGDLRNIPVLEKSAVGRGLFTIKNENDGIVRRVPMVMDVHGQIMPSLSLEMLRIAAGASAILIKTDASGIKSVGFRGFEMPTDRNGQLWIHFSPHDSERFVSAIDVLEGRVGSERIARKLVLVGTSAAGLLDLKTTPVDPAMPGVEVHAQVLESMLTRTLLAMPNYAVIVEFCAALLVGAVIIWLVPILGPTLLLVTGVLIVTLLVGTSWLFFKYENTLIDFTYPLLSSAFIFITLIFTNFANEQAKRREIRSAFGQYLSPALVDQLAQSPEKLVLGGEQRNMTIMFSDVRGFTTISEMYKDDPQGLTSLMNSFLTPLTNAIIGRKGTIDKYMGDAIMAFWNAPLYDSDHEINACEAAIDMLDCVEKLNQAREREAETNATPFIPIKIGIGINTGLCVVGNMGSDLRFDYSVLGDNVNLASRLEGQCKSYGLQLIVGAKTALAAKDKFAILEIDYAAVKGKKEPELVYAIIGRGDLVKSRQFQQCQSIIAKMLSCYRRRDWAGATGAIEQGRAVDNELKFITLYDVYAARIHGFQSNPPPEEWSGAYVLESK